MTNTFSLFQIRISNRVILTEEINPPLYEWKYDFQTFELSLAVTHHLWNAV